MILLLLGFQEPIRQILNLGVYSACEKYGFEDIWILEHTSKRRKDPR